MLRPEFVYKGADHARYHEHGFCLFDRFLTDAALQRCRAEIDRMLAELRPGHDPRGIIGAHQRGARWLWELAIQPALLDMIERQIGPNIVLWCSHLVCKPAGFARGIVWHQDAPYWNVSGRLAGGIWIPLDDVDEHNGSMHVWPASHRLGTLPRVKRELELFSEEIDPSALPADIGHGRVCYRLPAGGVAVHDPMLAHGSPPNQTARPRRVITLRYMNAEGTMGANTYRDWRTGEEFPRRYYLVRGEDALGRGLERAPEL